MEISWQSIIGQEAQIERLRTLRRERRLPHALLLVGPSGVGKLRVAHVLAAEILCLAEGERPCGHCAACRALEQDTHPDYYELAPEPPPKGKGKGNKSIRIEMIRALQAEVARLPLLSPSRVAVINDAEGMNEAAANSLLKTLEEPTGAVTFILVTQARSSLLPTILSRTMSVDFGMIPEKELAQALAGRGIPTNEAAELAALADGSFGRALALHENGGLALRDEAAKFLERRGQIPMQEVFRQGAALAELPREQLTEYFLYLGMLLRDLLVLAGEGESALLYHKDLRERLRTLLPAYPEARVFALLALVREAQRRLLTNVNLRLLLEGFLISSREV